MSHVAALELEIKDLRALKLTAERLGFEFVEGQKTFKWYGQWLNDWRDPTRAAAYKGYDPKTFGHCEHAIRIKGSGPEQYEIGVVKSPTGQGYSLIYDAYGLGHRLEQLGGTGMVKFKQPYAVEVAKQKLLKQGYKVKEVMEKGKIFIHAHK